MKRLLTKLARLFKRRPANQRVLLDYWATGFDKADIGYATVTPGSSDSGIHYMTAEDKAAHAAYWAAKAEEPGWLDYRD